MKEFLRTFLPIIIAIIFAILAVRLKVWIIEGDLPTWVKFILLK